MDTSKTTSQTGPVRVESLMRPSPAATTPTEILAVARAVMEREHVHQLPVIENGQLVGILAERDLHAHTGYLDRTKVDAAMTWNPITIAPGTTAQAAAQLLIDKQINAVPVVDNGRMVGIVSRTDLLQLLVRLLEPS